MNEYSHLFGEGYIAKYRNSEHYLVNPCKAPMMLVTQDLQNDITY